MKLAIRTALTYSILTAGIFLVFAYTIVLVSEKNQNDEFFDRLGYKITWRSELYFEAGMDESHFGFYILETSKY